MNENNLTLTLKEAKLPGRIISVKDAIGDTLADLCKMTAYDLSKLKGVGNNVIDDTRKVLSFYGVALAGDPEPETQEGAVHPIVEAYIARLNEKYPGMVEKLGQAPDREVGDEFGVSAQSINNHRRVLGIERAVRAKRLGKKDARIAALETAIREALDHLSNQTAESALEAETLLTSVLEPVVEITPEAAQAVMEALHADDDSADDEQEVEVDAGELAAESSGPLPIEEAPEDEPEVEAAPKAPLADGPQTGTFDFGDADFDTTDTDDSAPVGALTFS